MKSSVKSIACSIAVVRLYLVTAGKPDVPVTAVSKVVAAKARLATKWTPPHHHGETVFDATAILTARELLARMQPPPNIHVGRVATCWRRPDGGLG